MCHRRQDPGTPHLEHYTLDNGRNLLCGELKCDRKTRGLARVPKALLQVAEVDFDHYSIYPVAFRLGLFLPLPPIFENFLERSCDFEVRIYFEPKLAQIIQLFSLRVGNFFACLGNIVYEYIELARCRYFGVELAYGARGGVARIGELRLALRAS